VALSVECRICDQEIVGLSRGVKTLGKFFTPMPLSASSISWYRPKGSAPCGWGVKAGRPYGSCVGGR